MIVSDVAPPHKEAVMSQAISTQHPAVVLRPATNSCVRCSPSR